MLTIALGVWLGLMLFALLPLLLYGSLLVIGGILQSKAWYFKLARMVCGGLICLLWLYFVQFR